MDMLSVNDHSSVLLQFLYKLYQDQVLCDFEVIGYDGTSLWGHRLVLMASSKYIYNICMKNSDAKSLVLNINTDVLQMLLEFCYTGQLYVSPDNYKNVQEGAAFLQMTAAIESLTHQITEDVIRNKGIKDQSMYKTDRSLGFNEVIIKVEESTIFDSEQSSDKHLNLACSDIKQTTNSRNKHFKTNNSSKNTSSSNRSRSCTKGQGHMRSEGQGQTEEQNDQDIDTNIQYTTITARRSLGGFNSLKKSNKLQSREKKQHGKNSEQIKNKKSPKDKETSKTVNDKTVQRETKCTGAEPMCQNDKRSRLNIRVPKLLNRFCTHCNKSFTSVAKLQYHVTYYHPSYVCSNFRRVYIVKKCVKDSILRKKFTKQTDKHKCHVCKLCGKTFSKYSILSHHYLKEHRSLSKFANNWFGFCRLKMALCKIIVPLAKNRRNRLESIEKSSSPEKSVCYICEKQFSTLKTLNRHLMRIHQEGSLGRRKKGKKKESLLICIICQKSFSRPDVLCAHLMKLHKYSRKEANKIKFYVPEVRCEVQNCPYTSKDLQELNDHATECHPEIKHCCTKCSMTFKVLPMFNRHVQMCHKKLNYTCQLCVRVFNTKLKLYKHEYFKHKIHHENIKIFRCDYPGCNYEAHSSSCVKAHQTKHNTEKLFTCEYCGMKLKTEIIRRKHVDKMHLGIRPFLCQICGLSFGEKHELQSHITNRHSNERSYQCSHCPYSTAVKATFYTHLFNVHKVRADEDKRELLQCPYCPYTSILKYRYQTHVNSHTNTRKYECKVCEKSFVSANALRSHTQWVHSDKVFSCSQCDYQTKTTQKLNEHIRVQHQLQGFKPYQCPYCSFRCATGGNTRKHVKQVHKGAEVTYIRDDDLLRVARDARATGHYAPLLNSVNALSYAKEASEDDRPDLSENILHIAM